MPVMAKCTGEGNSSRMLTFDLGAWDCIPFLGLQAELWVLVRITASNFINSYS